MASIRGTVMLRPVRVALLTDAPKLEDVRRAVHAATSAWGGQYFPIVDVARGDDHVRGFEQLSIDVLWPVMETDATRELADQTGFRWRGRSPFGPFDPPAESYSGRLLEPHHLAPSARSATGAPTWDSDDPLSPLFGVWFGDFASDDYGELSRARFAGQSDAIVIQEASALDIPLIRRVSPIAATANEIEHTGEGPGPGFVIVDPTSPIDLLRFWNVRAAGGEVIPWVVGAEERLEPVVRSWIVALLAADGVRRWSHADGSPGSLYLSLWPFTDMDSLPAELKTLIDRHDIDVRPGHDGRGAWRGMHPLSTPFRRSFFVEVEARIGAVEVPLPSLSWASGRPASNWPGIIAAEIEVSGEVGLDPERTTSVPRVRRLATLLDTRGASDDTFHRPNGRGGVHSVSATGDNVTMMLAHPIAVFEGLLNQDEWTCEQSDDGRFASRLDHRLGGPDYQLAIQPAAREILLRAAVRGDLGSSFGTLRSLAVSRGGTWPDGVMDRRKPEDYARDLVLQLAERRLLRATLPMTCPSCRNVFSLEPSDLRDDVTCGFCDHRFPLALALSWLGPKANWRYRIAGHVSEARLLAALPVIATTSVLAKLARGGFDNCIDAKGLKIRQGRKELAEFDVATVIDTFRPIIILGEVKSHGDIDATDLANLSLAQQVLRDNGVECFVLVATFKKAFSGEEVALLRAHCEEARELIHSDYTLAPLALPLTFTRHQLSVGWFSDAHPWRWGDHWRGLSATARESCARNLGLVDIRAERDPAGFRYEFDWTAPSSSGDERT